MHEVYKKIWNVADKTGRFFPFTNRSWFLFYSTALWAVIGLIAGYFGNPLFGEQWHEPC